VPTQPTSAALQQQCSGRGVPNTPSPDTGAAQPPASRGRRQRCKNAELGYELQQPKKGPTVDHAPLTRHTYSAAVGFQRCKAAPLCLAPSVTRMVRRPSSFGAIGRGSRHIRPHQTCRRSPELNSQCSHTTYWRSATRSRMSTAGAAQ